MKLNFKSQLVFCLAGSLISILTSCAPAPAQITQTLTPPRPTASLTEPGPPVDDSILQSGHRYSDTSGDMEISFLDVVAFQTDVNEESETVEIVLQMRDIPPTAPLGQVRNVFEYLWMISVYLDPSAVSPSDLDFYIGLNTTIKEPNANPASPKLGTPVTVPINDLFEIKNTYDGLSRIRSTPDVVVNPDLDTLTITDQLPGITSKSLFTFSTYYYDGTSDEPDGQVSSESVDNSTPIPEATGVPPVTFTGLPRDDTTQLIPAGTVRAYPGPVHYAGDQLSFEIKTSSDFNETFPVSMAFDNMAPTEVQGTFSYFYKLIHIPLALDTTNLTGQHTVAFTTTDGDLNETYSFDVLPSDQRPVNETRAAWIIKETGCCIFHYISETAAARDIDFIAQNFDQGANDFESVMGTQVPTKMQVYILDRIWGNGGFGGNGELVISYTDRYYGPTVGGVGLQTVARHEFSHASGVGLDIDGDGVNINSEGMAVYVAGGHYKPEPLAQRGAALFDLGYFVPADEFIPQHELSYLHGALILTYIVDTYGKEKLWEVLNTDDIRDEQFLSLGDAIQLTLGVSFDDFNHGFQSWLERNEPGEQLDDLRLTIELQDLRRQYQDTYSPPPNFIFGSVADGVARSELLPVMLREARAPSNIAIELMIANAQRAIVAGSYAEADVLIQSIKEVVTTGDFANALANEYLEIVKAAGERGYEVLSLSIQNGYAITQVTNNPPETSILELQNINGVWQVQP